MIPHTHERVALWAVILGGIFALIFAFPYLGKNIVEPSALKPKTVVGPIEQYDQAQQALRERDTDQDGLVDYDELYVWNTSPYLADTDSDGFDDKTEALSGNDPNCPSGRDCARAPTTASGAQPGSADASGVPVVLPDDLMPKQDQVIDLFSGQGDMNALLQTLTELPPDQVRKLLLDNGVPKEVLDNLDDETVMSLYRDALKEAGGELGDQGSAAE